jgi:predicted dehydrogenase
MTDGTLGEPVSACVSRHITRGLGNKTSGRGKLSPAAMESTHDLDFLLWLLEPARPVRVNSQGVKRVMYPKNGAFDQQWIMSTLDNGCVITVTGGWIMPPGYPNFSTTWIEITGSEGALIIDDTHRGVWLSTMEKGTVFPLSSMSGEHDRPIWARLHPRAADRGEYAPRAADSHGDASVFLQRPISATFLVLTLALIIVLAAPAIRTARERAFKEG